MVFVHIVIEERDRHGLFRLPNGEVQGAAGSGEVDSRGGGVSRAVLLGGPVHRSCLLVVGPVEGHGKFDGPGILTGDSVCDGYLRKDVVVVRHRRGYRVDHPWSSYIFAEFVGVFVVVEAVSTQDTGVDDAVRLVHGVVACGHAKGGAGLPGLEGDRLGNGAGDVVSLLGHPHPHLQGPGHGIGLAAVAVQRECGGPPFGHGGLVSLDTHSHEIAVRPKGGLLRGTHRVLWAVSAFLGIVRAVMGISKDDLVAPSEGVHIAMEKMSCRVARLPRWDMPKKGSVIWPTVFVMIGCWIVSGERCPA